MAMKNPRLPSRSPLAIAIVAVAAGIAAAAVFMLRAPATEEMAASPRMSTSAPQLSDAISANPFARGEATAPQAATPAHVPTPPAVATAETGTGVFRADSNGVLLLDDATRMRLDILLSHLSKSATPHELQTVEAEAVAGLPAAAVQQALHILRTYIAYTSAQEDLAAAHASGPAVKSEEMLERLATLRRRHLGLDVAQALFGKQEQQERYGLQIAALDADTTLTAQEKLTRIEAMQQALPDGATELHASLEASRSSLSMEQGVAALRAQGGSEAQVRQWREQHVGTEGAAAIGELEAQKSDWERKQQAFAQQRSQIAQMNLSEQQKQEKVEALLRTLYSEEELPAARAYHQQQSSQKVAR